MLSSTLKYILNSTNNKYKTTVAAQKVFQKLTLNLAVLTPKERKEKMAIVSLTHIFEGKSKILEAMDVKDQEVKDKEAKDKEAKK
jgi:hypothetical protein